MKRPSAKLLVLFLLLPLVWSCSSEDEAPDYPSAITELVEATTDKSKQITTLRTDRGATLIVGSPELRTTKADTTYRCICMYEYTSTNTVKVYDLQTIFASLPLPTDKYDTHPRQPVSIISQWRSDRYINLVIRYMTINADAHAFGFCEDEVVTETDGTKTIRVSLLHKRPAADTEAFSTRLYISMPTYQYVGLYDHVAFTVKTDDGDRTYTYDL